MRVRGFRAPLLVLPVAVLLLFPAPLRVVHAQKQGGDQQGHGLTETTTRFSGTLSAVPSRGRATPFHVELKQWHLAGQGEPIEIRTDSFSVAHLIWGRVSIQMNGKTETRAPGDFWSADKGASMVLTIAKPGEEALIEIFSVRPGP